MKNNQIVYTMRGRVVWISDKLFHVPVIDDLCRVHQISYQTEVNLENCTNYIVEFFHKFAGNKLLLLSNNTEDNVEIKLAHEKIKIFFRLSEFVNHSYHASLPLVFDSEEDKIEILADSLMNRDSVGSEEFKKHHQFIESLIHDKKSELKKRYLSLVHQIKKASTFEEVEAVGYKIVFEGINVV